MFNNPVSSLEKKDGLSSAPGGRHVAHHDDGAAAPAKTGGRHVAHHDDAPEGGGRHVVHHNAPAPQEHGGGRHVVHHDGNNSEPKVLLDDLDPLSTPRNDGNNNSNEDEGPETDEFGNVIKKEEDQGLFGSLLSKLGIWGGASEEKKVNVMTETTVKDLERGVHTGQTVNHDGNSYKLPTMEAKFVDKKDYIPDEIARAKLHRASQEYNVAKDAFEKRIRYIEEMNTKAKAEREMHFKKHANDLREHAVRHVQVQRSMKQKMEERLTMELRQRDNTIDGLRDSVAELTGLSQRQTEEISKLGSEVTLKEAELGQLEVGFGVEEILRGVDEHIAGKERTLSEGRNVCSLSLQSMVLQVRSHSVILLFLLSFLACL
jgi:hypothetical protein